MALEDITTRILDKARHEAALVIQQAEEQAKAEKEKAASTLAHRITQAEEKATEEAEALHARVIASAHLEARKEELVAKRALISEAVDQALARIAESDEETYVTFLLKLLMASPFRGDAELILSPRDHTLMRRRLPEMQAALTRAGIDLTLRLSEETRGLTGGFVLRQGRIEYNSSLASIKRFREQELRSAAGNVLFGKES